MPAKKSHTPGPWEVITDSEDRDYVVVDGPGGVEVADCATANGESDNVRILANARLIASAPDYDAVARQWLDVESAMFSMATIDDKIEVLKRASAAFKANRAAIAKAEGK